LRQQISNNPPQKQRTKRERVTSASEHARLNANEKPPDDLGASNMKHTVSEISLKNGAKGLLVHIPDASVMTFDFNFRAGEYLVPRRKWEVPHIMEHLLLGANELIPQGPRVSGRTREKRRI